jgi:hypothetical protein
LIDAQASRDSDHLAIWATHCLAPHPKFPLRANFDLSPQKSGERSRKNYPISPFIGLIGAVGEHRLGQHALGKVEMIA